MRETTYDVVLYGASGFVGRQTVGCCADRVGDKVRWAIVGRDRQKLALVKEQVGSDVDILVADSQDRVEIDSLVSQTRGLLNTAGPFALYGDAIVDACVRYGTHYVYITGETPWVKGLIERYHLQAEVDGTRIIPCCGFDSVPSDLGAYLLARHLQQELGVSCTQVKAYYQLTGGFNGGTLANGLSIYDRDPSYYLKAKIKEMKDLTAEYLEYQKDRNELLGSYLLLLGIAFITLLFIYVYGTELIYSKRRSVTLALAISFFTCKIKCELTYDISVARHVKFLLERVKKKI
jgi:short subunit dehydrogenase-like uncharacterized protein